MRKRNKNKNVHSYIMNLKFGTQRERFLLCWCQIFAKIFRWFTVIGYSWDELPSYWSVRSCYLSLTSFHVQNCPTAEAGHHSLSSLQISNINWHTFLQLATMHKAHLKTSIPVIHSTSAIFFLTDHCRNYLHNVDYLYRKWVQTDDRWITRKPFILPHLCSFVYQGAYLRSV